MRRFLEPIFSQRFFKFAAVGGSGVVVNLGVLLLCSDVLHLHANVASALAILVSISSNFAVNECWTFADRQQRRAADVFCRWFKFHAVSLVGAAIQWTVFVCGNLAVASLFSDFAGALSLAVEHGWLGPIVQPPDVGQWKYLSQLAGIAVATLWNYLANFYWTWASRPPCDKL